MNLVSVERSFTVFYKKNGCLKAEYTVELDLAVLKVIVKPRKNDELLYLPYSLNKFQINKLINKLDIDLLIEMKTYCYFLECHGIYDYDN